MKRQSKIFRILPTVAFIAPTAVFASGNFGSLIVELLLQSSVIGLLTGAVAGFLYGTLASEKRPLFLKLVVAASLCIFGGFFVASGGTWAAITEALFWILFLAFVLCECLTFALSKRLRR